ncbi:MAG TPA: CHASE2 domain-containing protein [Terriglobales bacterium]|nr:CHASE2 domain-containing protein [Terriglobales bacterium]
MAATRRFPRRRTGRRDLILAVSLFLLVSALSLLPLAREWQLRVDDTYFRAAPQPPQRSPVVLVLIDDDSLQRYGRWPWSRTRLAELTERIHIAGARVIGLDILLAEPQTPEADRALAAALARSGGTAVLVDKIGRFPDGPRWIEPLPAFAEHAAVGHAQAVLDLDGVCRRFPPLQLTPEGARWAFPVEVARLADPARTGRYLRAYGIAERESPGSIAIAQPVLVPIAYRRADFHRISAAAVLEGADLGAVRDRTVLVGFGPTELGDRIATPFSGELPTPGVEVHAQMLDGILTGRSLFDLPWWVNALFLFATCLTIVTLSRHAVGWRVLPALAAATAAFYLFGLGVFLFGSRLLSFGAPLLAIVLGPLLAYSADLLVVERSVARQLEELQRWLEARHAKPAGRHPNDLFWRLAVLRRLQIELGSAYELHQALLESTADPVAVFDPQGELLLRNRAFAAAFPQEPPLDLARLRAELALGAGVTEAEVEVRDELYALHLVPMLPTTLSPAGGTIVRLASLRTRLERDRARAEALGFVTHELRTPLVAIQGFAQLMLEHPGVPAAASAPGTILLESRRLLELINSYLDVLRLETGARPLRLEEVSLGAVAQRIVDLLQPLADSAGMRLSLAVSAACTVRGDVSLLSGAVLNLVSNALKYADPGTDIRIVCSHESDDAVLGVYNRGREIPPELVPRLFDPFYRTAAAESAAPGTGLGLTFVQRILEQHGGTVRAATMRGETLFEIRLPLAVALAAKGIA